MWSAWQRKEVVEYMPPERDVKIGRQHDVTQFSQMRTETIYDKNIRAAYTNLFDNAYDSKTDIMHTLSQHFLGDMYPNSQASKQKHVIFRS